MLRALSRQHQVTYLCLDDGLAASDALERAREYAHEVVVVPFGAPRKMSIGFYAGSRAYLPRKWRLPAPQVQRGEPI